MASTQHLQIAGRAVRVSSLDKVFYPGCGFTKGEVIDYYIRIAPVLLDHLRGRAVTLKRYPDGVRGEFFYEKQCPSHAPEWVRTTPVKKGDGSVIHYCLLDDLPSLVWAANLANLEFHPFLHRARAPTRPTALMFDLDPGPPAGIGDCARVALRLRDLFAALDLLCFPKTSGSKGLQLVVPLNGTLSYRRTKPFAHAVAQTLAARFPGEIVAEMKKSVREGKVFIDWSQNDDGKTTVCAYSLRARETPTVSTPLRWEEVEKAGEHPGAAAVAFTATEVVARVKVLGDLHAPVLVLRQTLPRLAALRGLGLP